MEGFLMLWIRRGASAAGLVAFVTAWGTALASCARRAGAPGEASGVLCELEFALPEETRVIVDGREYAPNRPALLGPMEVGRVRRSKVQLKFREGGTEVHELLLAAGWKVRVAREQVEKSRPELAIQGGHSCTVNCVAFDPSGTKLLTGSWDGTAILWEAATGRCLRTFAANEGWVSSVAFSPVGNEVLTGSCGGTAVLWNAATGEVIRRFVGDPGGVSSAAFSSSGGEVLTGSLDGTAILWDATTGKRLRTLAGHAGPVTSVAFEPSGDRILTACVETSATGEGQVGWDIRVVPIVYSGCGERIVMNVTGGEARLWHARTGELIHLWKAITGLAFFALGGAAVVTEPRHGEAVLWDAESGQVISRLRFSDSWHEVLAVSPSGQTVFTDCFVESTGCAPPMLWDVATGEPLRVFRTQSVKAVCAVFSRTGREVLSGFSDGTAMLLGADSGRILRAFERRRAVAQNSLAIGASGEELVARFGVDAIGVWRAKDSALREINPGSAGAFVTCSALSPLGGQLLVGFTSGLAELWDLRTWRRVRVTAGKGVAVSSVALSPSGAYALIGFADGATILAELSTGSKRLAFEDRGEKIECVAFSPSGEKALTGLADGTIDLWETTTAKRLLTLRGAGRRWTLCGAAFRGSDGQVVACHTDGLVLWDAVTGRSLWRATFEKEFRREAQPLFCTSAAFTPPGHLVATGMSNGTVLLWEGITGRCLRTCHVLPAEGRTGAPLSSPDGGVVRLSGGRVGGGARFLLSHLSGGSALVGSVALSPSGQELVTTGLCDGAIRLWDVPTGKELAAIVAFGNGDWLVATPEGFFDGSEGGRERVAYRVGGTPGAVANGQLVRGFYRPGLLIEILRGELPMPQSVDAREGAGG